MPWCSSQPSTQAEGLLEATAVASPAARASPSRSTTPASSGCDCAARVMARGHFLPQRLAIELPAAELGQVRAGVVGPDGAEGVLPHVESEVVAALAEGGAPFLELGRLRVEDRPVEIEDDGRRARHRRPGRAMAFRAR